MTLADSWNDLADSIEPEPDWDEAPPSLVDLADVDRALARKARVQRRHQDDLEVAAARIDQIRAWLQTRTEAADAKLVYLDNQLASYHQQILRDDPRRKTISLPSGTLRASVGRLSVQVEDERAFVDWAKTNGYDSLLIEKFTASKSAIASADERLGVVIETETPELTVGQFVEPATGEKVPGIAWKQVGMTYKATPA